MEIYKDHNGLWVNTVNNAKEDGCGYHIIGGKIDSLGLCVFQTGPVPDNGVNGITVESLIAIAHHRLNYLNSQYPCDDNISSLTHLSNALAHLESRTKDRQARQVEGKQVA